LIDGYLNLLNLAFAGPGHALNHDRTMHDRRSVLRPRDERLHNHRVYRLEIGGCDDFARRDRSRWMAIGGLHVEALSLVLADRNVGEPLDAGGGHPSRGNHAQRGAMQQWQRTSVHSIGQYRVRMNRLLKWNTSHEQRHRGRDRPISSSELHVTRLGLYPGLRQHITQPHPGPLRIANRSPVPLNTGYLGPVKCATVSAALDHRSHGHGFHLSYVFQYELV